MKTKKIAALALAASTFASIFTVSPAQAQLPELPPLPSLPPAAPATIDVTGAVNPELISTPPNQDSPNNYVSFGDSMVANPTMADIAVNNAKRSGVDINWPTIVGKKCAQDPNNFPRQVARATGLRLDDYSCGGVTAYTDKSDVAQGRAAKIEPSVDQAIAEGALGSHTKLVTMMVGFNEFYQPTQWKMSPQERDVAYRNTMIPVMNKIKAAAPNAKIQLLGYPDETDGKNNTCGSNVQGINTYYYFPMMSYFQDTLAAQQAETAQATGVQYIPFKDEINVARGNSGCLPHGPRLNATIVDDSPHNLFAHLTDNGHQYYAQRIVEEYNR